jgi:hypothetical protein
MKWMICFWCSIKSDGWFQSSPFLLYGNSRRIAQSKLAQMRDDPRRKAANPLATPFSRLWGFGPRTNDQKSRGEFEFSRLGCQRQSLGHHSQEEKSWKWFGIGIGLVKIKWIELTQNCGKDKLPAGNWNCAGIHSAFWWNENVEEWNWLSSEWEIDDELDPFYWGRVKRKIGWIRVKPIV